MKIEDVLVRLLGTELPKFDRKMHDSSTENNSKKLLTQMQAVEIRR